MIKSLIILLIVVSFGRAAEAKIMEVPSDESPLASIDIPDSWNPGEITDCVNGSSEDSDALVVGNEGQTASNEEIAAAVQPDFVPPQRGAFGPLASSESR